MNKPINSGVIFKKRIVFLCLMGAVDDFLKEIENGAPLESVDTSLNAPNGENSLAERLGENARRHGGHLISTFKKYAIPAALSVVSLPALTFYLTLRTNQYIRMGFTTASIIANLALSGITNPYDSNMVYKNEGVVITRGYVNPSQEQPFFESVANFGLRAGTHFSIYSNILTDPKERYTEVEVHARDGIDRVTCSEHLKGAVRLEDLAMKSPHISLNGLPVGGPRGYGAYSAICNEALITSLSQR